MSFMQPELTIKMTWLEIDGSCGIEYIPEDIFDVGAVRRILDDDTSDQDDLDNLLLPIVGGYLESRHIFSAELTTGYGVRSSAAGYLDCTPWTVYPTLKKAEDAYQAEERQCEGDNEEDSD